VMNVEGRVRLSVAHGHSKVDERLALVEVRSGCFGFRTFNLHHLDSCGEKVIGDDLMPSVRPPLEAGGEDWARLEQRIVGSRQGIDVYRALHVCAKTHEIVRLGEHFLAVRQLSNDRRWKHFSDSLVVCDRVIEVAHSRLPYRFCHDKSTKASSSLAESISSSAIA